MYNMWNTVESFLFMEANGHELSKFCRHAGDGGVNSLLTLQDNSIHSTGCKFQGKGNQQNPQQTMMIPEICTCTCVSKLSITNIPWINDHKIKYMHLYSNTLEMYWNYLLYSIWKTLYIILNSKIYHIWSPMYERFRDLCTEKQLLHTIQQQKIKFTFVFRCTAACQMATVLNSSRYQLFPWFILDTFHLLFGRGGGFWLAEHFLHFQGITETKRAERSWFWGQRS